MCAGVYSMSVTIIEQEVTTATTNLTFNPKINVNVTTLSGMELIKEKTDKGETGLIIKDQQSSSAVDQQVQGIKVYSE